MCGAATTQPSRRDLLSSIFQTARIYLTEMLATPVRAPPSSGMLDAQDGGRRRTAPGACAGPVAGGLEGGSAEARVSSEPGWPVEIIRMDHIRIPWE